MKNFRELQKLAEQKDVGRTFSADFSARLKAREEKFEEKSKRLSPTDNFFARSYNL